MCFQKELNCEFEALKSEANTNCYLIKKEKVTHVSCGMQASETKFSIEILKMCKSHPVLHFPLTIILQWRGKNRSL